MAQTSISWTEQTWNPIVGCSVVSPGCTNCYAMKEAWRFGHNPKLPQYHGLTQMTKGGSVWNGKVKLAEKALLAPLARRKPTMYFVNSMGDLFHENVPDDWIDRVFAVMALCPQHTFQVLTKRSARMREYMTTLHYEPHRNTVKKLVAALPPHTLPEIDITIPAPNVWLGVSAEDQTRADERIPDLLATPAAIRFVSAEPLLGPVNFLVTSSDGHDISSLRGIAVNPTDPDGADEYYRTGKLDWIITGGESGPNARPMHPDWVRNIRDQCAAAGVAFHFKQWGEFVQAASAVCSDSDMTSNKAFWLGWDGTQAKPSHHGLDWPIGVIRVGKARAGRLLDGRTHDDMPGVTP